MSYGANPFDTTYLPVAAQAETNERASFITKTYLHLVGAIGAFAVLEVILLNMPFTEALIGSMFSFKYSWLMVLGGFMIVNMIANSWAHNATSPAMQYAGLSLYVVAQSVIFVPLLYMANQYEGVITTAALTTLCLFGGLTVIVFYTRKDFSFLRGILLFGGLAGLGFIVCAIVFNFALGPIFTYAMIALACGYILYDTSNVLHHYRIGQHVAASLALFSSIAMLFWHIVVLFLRNAE